MLPKIELHLHLDCSLSYDVVRTLRPSITRDQFEHEFIAPAKCTNLADFLTRAPKGIELMQTERELRAVTSDLFRQLQADNVLYAEIRFAPLLHATNGLSDEAVVQIVNDATDNAISDTGIHARLILCTLRHFTEEQSLRTVTLLEKFKGTNVVALDLAADEAGHPITPHVSAFRLARRSGLYRTAHAGEARGADSVWETLKNFAPTRIGHGVRSMEDPKLIDFLRANRIHLEVCPSSNLQTNVYDDMRDHPIARLYEAGVPLGISTDARTITNITLEQEYAKLREAFGWTAEHFLRCNLDAVEAAFIPEKLKRELAAKLKEGYEREIVAGTAPEKLA